MIRDVLVEYSIFPVILQARKAIFSPVSIKTAQQEVKHMKQFPGLLTYTIHSIEKVLIA